MLLTLEWGVLAWRVVDVAVILLIVALGRRLASRSSNASPQLSRRREQPPIPYRRDGRARGC